MSTVTIVAAVVSSAKPLCTHSAYVTPEPVTAAGFPNITGSCNTKKAAKSAVTAPSTMSRSVMDARASGTKAGSPEVTASRDARPNAPSESTPIPAAKMRRGMKVSSRMASTIAPPQLERCGSAAASSSQRRMITGTASIVPRSTGMLRSAFADSASSPTWSQDSCAVSNAPTSGALAMKMAPALAAGTPAAMRDA